MMMVAILTVPVIVAFCFLLGTKCLPQGPSRKIKYGKDSSAIGTTVENVPSTARVAAGAFGFLTLIQTFDGPERFGAFQSLD